MSGDHPPFTKADLNLKEVKEENTEKDKDKKISSSFTRISPTTSREAAPAGLLAAGNSYSTLGHVTAAGCRWLRYLVCAYLLTLALTVMTVHALQAALALLDCVLALLDCARAHARHAALALLDCFPALLRVACEWSTWADMALADPMTLEAAVLTVVQAVAMVLAVAMALLALDADVALVAALHALGAVLRRHRRHR